MKLYVVFIDKPVTTADVVVTFIRGVASLLTKTSYPATVPELSVEAAHVRFTLEVVFEGEVKFPGTVGGVVSPLPTKAKVILPRLNPP